MYFIHCIQQFSSYTTVSHHFYNTFSEALVSPSEHPAGPSLVYLESQSRGKDQLWPAAWQSDLWCFGMVFFHRSCSTGCIQGTTHLLWDLSLEDGKQKCQCYTVVKLYNSFKCKTGLRGEPLNGLFLAWTKCLWWLLEACSSGFQPGFVK